MNDEQYPHRLIIRRGVPGGSTNPTTGAFVPGGVAKMIYDDGADVQDQEVVITRDLSGTPTAKADAQAFLEDEEAVLLIENGDTGVVDGDRFSNRDCTVVGKRVLDALVFLNWR